MNAFFAGAAHRVRNAALRRRAQQKREKAKREQTRRGWAAEPAFASVLACFALSCGTKVDNNFPTVRIMVEDTLIGLLI